MANFSVRPSLRSLWIASVVGVVTAVWTCADQRSLAQAPAGGTPVANPPAASEPAAATPEATAVNTPDAAARRASCENIVAALSGESKHEALLKDPQVEALAKRVPDLLTCRAVKEDSDGPCKLLEDERAVRSCRAKQSTFHEWRAYPNGRAFMFNNVQFEDCGNFKPFAPYCEGFRAAARAGDASKCKAVGEFESLCRGLITLDKSLCSAPKGKDFQGRDQGNSQTWADGVEKDCKRQIDGMALYAKGMKAVADSGTPLDRQLAKAALGQPDACAPSAEDAIKTCVANLGAPAPSQASPAN
jgi:hypothetical protein